MKPVLSQADDVDIAAIGYSAVRAAFNETLQLCVEKLTKADLTLADEILGTAALDEEASGLHEMLADTALYSRKGAPVSRAANRRAVDRIAPKLAVKRDPLKAAIAVRLPQAIFSVFAIEETHADGGVLARDLLDDGRVIHIMDQTLAAQASTRSEIILAGRFLDLGPWHVGFGIVLPLRPSEALAITLTLSQDGEADSGRDNLHELLYPANLHGDDLVMAALEPMIMAFAFAVDTGALDPDEVAARVEALLHANTKER